jgi:dihydroxyacetone kinase-like predicted kinase
MSVRAYKIITLEVEDSPTFNLWHDDFIMDNLSYSGELDDGGSGIIEIYEGNVEEILENFETYWEEYQKEDKTEENKTDYKKKLERLLEEVKESGGYGLYQCY